MKKTFLLLALPFIAMACDDIEPISDEIPYNERGYNGNYYNPGNGGYRNNPGNGGYRAQPVRNTFDLVCPNKNYTAYYAGAETLKVNYDGGQTLNRVRSGNGEKYQNGKLEVFIEGDEALISTPFNDPMRCDIVS